MLTLKEPTPEIYTELKHGLMEIKANPSAYDIQAVQKLCEFSDKNFEGLPQYLSDHKDPKKLRSDRVPSTIFCLFDNHSFVGVFHVRHYLNDALLQIGGHVGIEILPSFRGRGYAQAGLKLILAHCQNHLHLERILVTADADNIPSVNAICHVMREIGGYMAPDSQRDGVLHKRVWIKTEKRGEGVIRALAIAVIRRGNQVLAIKGYDSAKQKYFYRLPGGGIHFGETSADALKREMKEEVNLDIEILRPLPASENIFHFEKRAGHEIALPYECRLSAEAMKQDAFPMIEPELKGFEMRFVDMDSPIPFFPENIIPPKDA